MRHISDLPTEHSWEQPRTDWNPYDAFNVPDYDRINGNMIFLQEAGKILGYAASLEKCGAYSGMDGRPWECKDFNIMESNLESLCVALGNANAGTSKIFVDNGPFVTWDELNRIESTTFELYQILDNIYRSMRRLPFRLGAYKGIRT